MPIVCVPNVSEGRRAAVVAACASALRTAGVALLDASADAIHHRSVYTFSGSPAALAAAVHALFDAAIVAIDLRHHTGQHPRIGAVDVVPFVPIGTTSMAECVTLARQVAADVADRHGLPVFLYGEAAFRPDRRKLEDIRRGGYEGLMNKLTQAEWRPDFGPTRPHLSAGASAIGARGPLIAYNVNLKTDRHGVAARIAHVIRERSGGLPAVKAMAVDLTDRHVVQVSMNLTDYRLTSIETAFDAVKREAARDDVEVLESELIGLAPAAALTPAIAKAVHLRDFSAAMILERRLADAGLA
jgi:glutamate formiminotransferase